MNQILHLFGRAIVFQYDITGSIEEVYFAKCKFRGFAEPVTSEGYKNLTAYLQKNIETISEDLDKE